MKAVAKERNELITIFQDTETGEFYKYFYVSKATLQPSLYCKKGHEVTEKELRSNGALIKCNKGRPLKDLIKGK